MAEGSDYTGRALGNWELVRLLGEGGFGAVYEARNTVIAGRFAAVKVLHPHLSYDADAKRRFLNEASAASRAEHENIIQVFDGGVAPDGLCYAVMELLKGRTLAAALAEGPLDVLRGVNLGVQVASALRAAHGIGIVHRDLKPDNIFMVPRETNPEFVKVLDFGIAKLSAQDGFSSGLSKTGQMMGTPRYMSPEQWRSEPTIDGRADVYALGLILFESMAGRLPFDSRETMYGWLAAHLNDKPALLSDVTPTAAGMSQLVDRMIAKSRDDRPQSMQEVVEALLAIKANPGVLTAGSAGTSTGAAKPPVSTVISTGRSHSGANTLAGGAGELRPVPPDARRSSGWLVGGIALALCGLGGGGYLWSARARHGTADPAPHAGGSDPAKSSATPPAVHPLTTATAAIDTPPPPSPSPLAAPVAAHFKLRTVPPSAEVTLDGATIQNPFAGSFPRGDLQHRLEVRARGYRTEAAWLVFDADHDLEVKLTHGSGTHEASVQAHRRSAQGDDESIAGSMPLPHLAEPEAGSTETKHHAVSRESVAKETASKESTAKEESHGASTHETGESHGTGDKPIYKGTKGKLIQEFPQ